MNNYKVVNSRGKEMQTDIVLAAELGMKLSYHLLTASPAPAAAPTEYNLPLSNTAAQPLSIPTPSKVEDCFSLTVSLFRCRRTKFGGLRQRLQADTVSALYLCGIYGKQYDIRRTGAATSWIPGGENRDRSTE
jgi:hypothetical protein